MGKFVAVFQRTKHTTNWVCKGDVFLDFLITRFVSLVFNIPVKFLTATIKGALLISGHQSETTLSDASRVFKISATVRAPESWFRVVIDQLREHLIPLPDCDVTLLVFLVYLFNFGVVMVSINNGFSIIFFFHLLDAVLMIGFFFINWAFACEVVE